MTKSTPPLGSQDDDWGKIGRALVAHAVLRSRRYPRLRGDFWPTGKGPEDIVGDLIVKYLTGVRKRDPRRYPDLLIFLKMHVNSLIDQLAKGQAANKEDSMPIDRAGSMVGDRIELAGQKLLDCEVVNPERRLEIAEEEQAAQRRVAALYGVVENKPDLRELLDAILAGCSPKPRLLAQWLGLELREISNRLRRLRRLDLEKLPSTERQATRASSAAGNRPQAASRPGGSERWHPDPKDPADQAS